MTNKTTIGVTKELVAKLTAMKTHPKESYEDVINRLLGESA